MDQTEALLKKWKHPDPYRPPTAPGGSKYERNLQAPILDRELTYLRFETSGELTRGSSSTYGSLSWALRMEGVRFTNYSTK